MSTITGIGGTTGMMEALTDLLGELGINDVDGDAIIDLLQDPSVDFFA